MIQKWGNSLALRISKTLAAEARLVEGEQVELCCNSDGILLKPRHRKRYRLRELVAGIRDTNRHSEVSFGP